MRRWSWLGENASTLWWIIKSVRIVKVCSGWFSTVKKNSFTSRSAFNMNLKSRWTNYVETSCEITSHGGVTYMMKMDR
jgi:hypothetical protein